MATTWERLDAGTASAALQAPELRVAWSFLRVDEAVAYRSSGGTAAVLPLGAWLADRQAGIEWVPAPAGPGIARAESLALLEASVTPDDVQQLCATSEREGINISLLSVLPPASAPAELPPAGTLILKSRDSEVSLPVYRARNPVAVLHESPAAMRKRGEGPDNLRERERWFRDRTGSGR